MTDPYWRHVAYTGAWGVLLGRAFDRWQAAQDDRTGRLLEYCADRLHRAAARAQRHLLGRVS